MKKFLKNNKGSITTVVLVTVLFFVTILSTGYMVAATLRQGQLKSELVAKETYEKPLNNLEELADEINGVTLPSTAETTPWLPDSTFKVVDGTLDTGLVIADKEGNEYVWVVVPKSLYDDTKYNSDGSKKPVSGTDYENIEYCLQQYTATYRNGTSYSDTYAQDSTSGWFKNADEYTAEKQKMLKSVYENGGFYVGRYEAGIETSGKNRTTAGEATETPVSKANAYPYNYVTRTQAKVLAEKIKYTNGDKSYTGSLMFGVQWDLVLAFMSKDTAKVTDTSILTSNSKTIGNYNDNLWTIKNANAQYSTDGKSFTACPNPYEKKSALSILLTTGADSSFSVQNIYDIAGNVYEWTLENTSITDDPCAGRGGGYNPVGSSSPAANRDYGSTHYSGNGIGFRVSLF